MKFVHIADIHFDSPFTILSQKKDLGDLRRIEQRQVFKKVIEYIKQNDIKYFFISGDLYEQDYVRKSTIDFINNCFREISNTNIFISPGNHDPYIKNSYYNQYNWNSNVHIFKPQIEKIDMPEVDVYGFGFDDFICNRVDIENMNIENKEKLNFLIIHGSLDASDKLQMQYNPITSNIISKKGFDYVALGHIHKSNFNENTRFVYPGSTISFGFDELGEHGMIVGDIDKNKFDLKFIKLDDRVFEERCLDITDLSSQEEIIEKINFANYEQNKMYKIILVGYRNFEINLANIQKMISVDNVIKIKDKTSSKYDLKELANMNNLKGIFVRNMLAKVDSGEYCKEDIERAIEIGLNAM